jgi:RNA polymerase sigma-70 factor (ECF subfamily)
MQMADYRRETYTYSMAKNQTFDVLSAFRKKEGILRSFIRRFIGDQSMVDDICQETITRALEAEKQRCIDAPDRFLFGVARNVVRKQLDAQSRSLLNFVEDLTALEIDGGGPSLEQEVDDQQRMLLFTESVRKLPKQCQRVFVLKKVYGYSHKEISAKLGISISTIEKHVAAGVKRCLDDMDNGAGSREVTSLAKAKRT